MDNKRNYGIDLLRIVSMIMICALHVLGHGGPLKICNHDTMNYYGIWFLNEMCICAVDCYALISGYVSVNRTYKRKKIIDLWLTAFFYTFSICFGAFVICSIIDIGKKVSVIQLIQSLFPIIYGNWYFTSYFLLFLLMPFVDDILNSIKINNYKKFLFIIFILIIVCTIGEDNYWFSYGYSSMWLLVMYIVGSIINRIDKEKNTSIIMLIGVYILSTSVTFYFDVINNKLNWGQYTSISVVISAISLLLLFSKINIKSKLVEKISPLTFGAYLFHDNDYVRSFFIADRFVSINNYNVVIEIIIIILISIVIFVISIFVDYIRKCLFEKLNINKIRDRIYGFICKVLN